MYKGAEVVYFKVLTRNSPGGTAGNRQESWSRDEIRTRHFPSTKQE